MVDQEQYLGQIESINSEGARLLKDTAIEIASDLNVSNILILVFGREGALLSAQALGSVSRMNSDIAFEKAKTVLATQRSTSIQRRRMEETGNKREDYGNRLGSLITGGVSIFKEIDSNEKLIGFLGAIVVAGAYPAERDQEICVKSLIKKGFATDIVL